MTLRRLLYSIPLPATLFLLALVLVVALPSAASATGRIGIGGFGSWNKYAMDDLNDEFIDALNDSLAAVGASGRLDEIKDGIGFGGGLRYESGPNFQFALDYERLTGSTDVSEGGGSFTIDVPANAATLTVTYLLSSPSKVHFGFAGGLGYYSSAGSSKLEAGSGSFSSDLEGHGFGFHAGGALDAALSSQVSAHLFAGWRQAKTTDIKVDGDKIKRSNGDDATLDWSGISIKGGLDFYFGMTGAK